MIALIRNSDPFSLRCTWSVAEMSAAVPPMRVRQPSALHITSHTEMNSAPSGTSFSRNFDPDPSACALPDRSGISR
jgi:hypothetical protein